MSPEKPPGPWDAIDAKRKEFERDLSRVKEELKGSGWQFAGIDAYGRWTARNRHRRCVAATTATGLLNKVYERERAREAKKR